MSEQEDDITLSPQALADWHTAIEGAKRYDTLTQMNELSLRSSKRQQASVKQDAMFAPFKPPLGKRYAPLVCGALHGVDKATSKKLKRGQLPIDYTLDLHGFNQEQAFDRLEQTIMSSMLNHHRLLLVITGKGRLSHPSMLKQAMPNWLNDERLRPYLLAFDEARREDGGSGAFYILLKKWTGKDDR